MSEATTSWSVLLIGGPSGGGKSHIARQLGLRFGKSWLAVDDLRLAFQRSQVILPRQSEALSFFEKTEAVWNLPAERLRDGLIALGEVMSQPLR